MIEFLILGPFVLLLWAAVVGVIFLMIEEYKNVR